MKCIMSFPPKEVGHYTLRINLQSHAFLQTYGAILPTSLTYIVLSARGCSPWRPAAVMGTTRSGRTLDPKRWLPITGSAPYGFQGPSTLSLEKRTPHKAGVFFQISNHISG